MSPQMIFAILALVQEAVTLEPALAAQLQTIFSKPNPTPEDWQNLRLQVLGKSYADYVPASALPPASAPAPAPGVSTPPAESNAPITQPGASAEAQNQVQDQKAPDPAPATPAPAAPVASYPHVITAA